jgi:crotonobetainyl-CoA:carnitine CoA-transferase CaiB-like acyl-CoA transferase
VNWNKKHYLLDLDEEEDRNTVYEWIKTADVVISNFKLASAKSMGVDYETLKSIKENIIYAQLTGYGEDDDTPVFDVVMQAEAGFLYMTGEPKEDEDPIHVRMPVAMIDLVAAHQLKEAILIALLQRERSGEGAYVTASLYDSAVASLANQATNYLMEGYIPQPMGSKHPNIAPYGDIYFTKENKFIVLAIGTEQQYLDMCNSMGLTNFLQDARFRTNASRVANREDLNFCLQAAFAVNYHDDIMAGFKKYKVPAGSIRSMDEVFKQEKAQRLILTEEMEDNVISKRVKTAVFEIRH